MPGEATAVDVDGVRRGGAICSSSGTRPARPHREAPVRPLPPDDEGHQTPPSMPPTLRGRPRLPPSVATPRARVRVRANCSARRTRPSPPDRSRETTRAAGDPTVRRRRPRTPDDGGGRRPPSHARRDPRRASARVCNSVRWPLEMQPAKAGGSARVSPRRGSLRPRRVRGG